VEGGAGRGDSAEPGPPLAPTRPRPPGSSSSPALRSPSRPPPALAPPPPAPEPAPPLCVPVSPPTLLGSPSGSRGSLPPLRAQPYLGKIFSCRRRRRQEGLNVAPSINSCRLGLPRGLGSSGVGVSSPALRRPTLRFRRPPRATLDLRAAPRSGTPRAPGARALEEQRRGPGSWRGAFPHSLLASRRPRALCRAQVPPRSPHPARPPPPAEAGGVRAPGTPSPGSRCARR
jgi:hypothetical protein